MYYEEEQGCAFSALLMNEVMLVSADVHIRQVQKQGLWLVALLWLWQRAQYAADVCLGTGKTDGGRLFRKEHNSKFQVNTECKREIETPQTPVFSRRLFLKIR